MSGVNFIGIVGLDAIVTEQFGGSVWNSWFCTVKRTFCKNHFLGAVNLKKDIFDISKKFFYNHYSLS